MTLVLIIIFVSNLMAVHTALDNGRTLLSPVPDTTLISWPDLDVLIWAAMLAPFASALVFAAAVKSEMAARIAIGAMTAGLALMVIGDYGAISSRTAILPDHIERTRWGRTETIPLTSIHAVEAGCVEDVFRGRRSRKPKPRPVYDLILADGGRVALGAGHDRSRFWLPHVAALDARLETSGISSGPYSGLWDIDPTSPRCLSSWLWWRDSSQTELATRVLERAAGTV